MGERKDSCDAGVSHRVLHSGCLNTDHVPCSRALLPLLASSAVASGCAYILPVPACDAVAAAHSPLDVSSRHGAMLCRARLLLPVVCVHCIAWFVSAVGPTQSCCCTVCLSACLPPFARPCTVAAVSNAQWPTAAHSPCEFTHNTTTHLPASVVLWCFGVSLPGHVVVHLIVPTCTRCWLLPTLSASGLGQCQHAPVGLDPPSTAVCVVCPCASSTQVLLQHQLWASAPGLTHNTCVLPDTLVLVWQVWQECSGSSTVAAADSSLVPCCCREA